MKTFVEALNEVATFENAVLWNDEAEKVLFCTEALEQAGYEAGPNFMGAVDRVEDKFMELLNENDIEINI